MYWKEAIKVSHLKPAKDLKAGDEIYSTNLRFFRIVEKVIVSKQVLVTIDGIEEAKDKYKKVRVKTKPKAWKQLSNQATKSGD